MLGLAIAACTNKNPESLVNWNNYSCREAFLSYIYGAALNDTYTDVAFNKDNYDDLQVKFSNFLTWYNNPSDSGYTFTNDVNSPQYNFDLQNNLINICNDNMFPGICDPFLTTGPCNNVSQGDISGNNVLTSLCGCYTKQSTFDQYSAYTLGTLGCLTGGTCDVCSEIGPNCVLINACNPTCNKSNVIQLATITPEGTGVYKQTCPKSFCIIDQTTINIENSNIPGGINFNNQCGGCGIDNLGCVCVVNGTNINTTMANIGVGVNFNTLCNSTSSTCIENGNIVPCNINPTNAEVDNKTTISWKFMIFIGIIILIILIISAIAMILYYRK